MTVQEAIDYIENFTWSRTKMGLARTRELLEKLGDPQKKLKFIHVAGTNGKGSTCAMLESILRHAGYRTGLYTSPFIETFCERIRFCGQNIEEDALAEITERVAYFADRMEDHPTRFELITAIGMLYFVERACDIVILEVGMGGLYDSTNVIEAPEAAVITNIGYDHTEYLGETLGEIAVQKAGIIKPGTDVICYDNTPDVIEVIRDDCRKKGARFHPAGNADVRLISSDLVRQQFMWKGHLLALSLPGIYQLRNAAVVLKTIEVLRKKGIRIETDAVREGLLAVRWPARFEVLSTDPLFILDGGHNPQCAEAVAENIRQYLPDREITMLMGVLHDKDYEKELDILDPYIAEYFCITPENPRALPAEKLAETIRRREKQATACETIPEGIRKGLSSGRPLLAFGSLYTAGDIRREYAKMTGEAGR